MKRATERGLEAHAVPGPEPGALRAGACGSIFLARHSSEHFQVNKRFLKPLK